MVGNRAEQIEELVRRTQRDRRLPSLVVVARGGGEPVAEVAVGSADLAAGLAAGFDVQYRWGSITKTLTSVALLQLAAEGRLRLTDRLGELWPDAPHSDLVISDLMSHTSGLQREPVGEVWESLELPSESELSANAAAARRLYPAGGLWHYSNLGFALLGEVVARTSGIAWEEYVSQRILAVLGMTRTSLQPAPPHAQGYAVEPFQDTVLQEIHVDSRSVAPAAQVWGTARDLARWAEFLAVGDNRVLAPGEMGLMRTPRVLADLNQWTLAFSTGLMLIRRDSRVFMGHTGSMPGFVAAAFADPGSRTSVAVLCNKSAGIRVGALAAEVLELMGTGEVVPWIPDEPAPAELRPVLGRWWSEWSEWTFRWSRGQLVAEPADSPPGAGSDRFRQVGTDLFEAESGTERGEHLRIVRDSEGRVVKLYWATYPFTRSPKAFGQG